MKHLTFRTNKCLLDLGNGVNALQISLDAVLKCGLKDVIIVTGYKKTQFNEYINRYSDLNIKLVFNRFYDLFGNIFSLWTARDYMDEDFIVINGDVVFHYSILKQLLDKQSNQKICMVIDRKQSYDEDDMKIKERDGRILKVSKTLNPHEVNGESVGMIRFCGQSREKLKSVLEEIVEKEENRKLFYLEAIQWLINRGCGVDSVDVPVDLWLEMDTPSDYYEVKAKLGKIIG